jgi:hypothetical protein
VFKAMLDYNGAKHGSPKFSVIEINDDWPDPNDVSKERHCRLATDIHSDSSSDIDSDGDDDKDTITDAVTNGPRDGKPSHIILCPSFFDFGIINGGLRAAPPGSSQPVTCNTVGTRVGNAMRTMGHTLVHEYTHVVEIMEPVLGNGITERGCTKDHKYGFFKCRKLEKKWAKENADSYANFATELFWTTTCNRNFAPPWSEKNVAVHAAAEQEIARLESAISAKGGPAATKGSSAAMEASTAKGGPATIATKGASSAKGTGTPSTKGASTAAGIPSMEGPSTATGTQQQKSQREIQSDLSLHKRTAFSQPYRYPVPKTDVDNTYPAEQMDQFLEGHVDALQLCRVVIKQSTKNPTGFDKVFREYFALKDRELVISKFVSETKTQNLGS